MTYEFAAAIDADKNELADIRIEAMRESLEAIGRFDPDRARRRFVDNFSALNTTKIIAGDRLLGFYVLVNHGHYLQLDHLYIHPHSQGHGLGGQVLESIKREARQQSLPIRLGALRESRSNEFYQQHGFLYTHEEEWDIYYEYPAS